MRYLVLELTVLTLGFINLDLIVGPMKIAHRFQVIDSLISPTLYFLDYFTLFVKRNLIILHVIEKLSLDNVIIFVHFSHSILEKSFLPILFLVFLI